MSDDAVAAVHEAAHALFAVSGRWTRLAGPVALAALGAGDVVMATDGGAIARSKAEDPAFDRDLPRLELVRALLAGPMAERLLAERGQAALDPLDLAATSAGDYAVVAEQLAALDPPRPELLPALEREVRARLEEPETWRRVERFAAILLDRRALTADDASEILRALEEGRPGQPRNRERLGRRLWLGLFFLWEGWWAWEFVSAPRPDEAMRTIFAVLLGLVLPGAVAALIGATILAVSLVRRAR